MERKLTTIECEYDKCKKVIERFTSKIDKLENERSMAANDLMHLRDALVVTSRHLTNTKVQLVEIEQKANEVDQKINVNVNALENAEKIKEDNNGDEKNNSTGDDNVVTDPDDQKTLSSCCALAVK